MTHDIPYKSKLIQGIKLEVDTGTTERNKNTANHNQFRMKKIIYSVGF